MEWKRRLDQQGLTLVLIRYDGIEGSVAETKAWLERQEVQTEGTWADVAQ